MIGLYLNPPQHAVALCVDEKTAIQALDRKDPVLPLSPGRAERHGFEYGRHGTLSLYAALDTQTGEVHGKTTARHTSQEFVAFLTDIVVRQPEDREIHIILDNLSAHKTQRVQEFLHAHPNVNLHFTPTYSSWLQPGRAVVLQDRAGPHLPRCLHVREGSLPPHHGLHRSLQRRHADHQVAVR